MNKPLPDAEDLLARLAERMRASVTPDTALIGIHTGGVWIAQRLHKALALRQPLGTIDVSFYRDDYGRPQSIRLAALIDRGGRQLPIAAQFVGAEVSAADGEQIELRRNEKDQLSLVLSRPGTA